MGAGFSGLAKEIDVEAASLKPNLGDLPESCVALILSKLGPLEICRLACLNRTFRQASLADFLWEFKLHRNYEILAQKLFRKSTMEIPLCKKELYAKFCCPIRFDADTKEIWMEKNNGGISVAISWKGLKITGINDRRFWNHISTGESRFHTIAYLQQIWWLEAEGELEFEFPPGTYNLFFRLKLGKPSTGELISRRSQVYGWNVKPVRFQLSLSDGRQLTSLYNLNAAAGKWTNYFVGEFLVGKTQTLTKLRFSMTQIDCTHSKGGVSLDCVLISPTKP